MKFDIHTAHGEIVLRDVTEDNVYITGYGKYVGPDARTIPIGHATRKRFALSGQKETEYLIVRTA